MLKYSAKPPQTPNNILSFFERVNFFILPPLIHDIRKENINKYIFKEFHLLINCDNIRNGDENVQYIVYISEVCFCIYHIYVYISDNQNDLS
jgi:hypothetical protein